MGYFNQVSILRVQGGVVGFAEASWLFCSRSPNIYMGIRPVIRESWKLEMNKNYYLRLRSVIT